MKLTLPTYLTLGRLAAAAALPLLYVAVPHPKAFWLISALFLIASITDWLDGYLARKLGQISNLGRMLDPIADKILVSTALLIVISCMEERAWLLIPATVILAREFLVSGLREFSGGGGSSLKTTFPAKCKTALQMAGLLILMLCCALDAHRGNVLPTVGIVAIWIAAMLTIFTGADYFKKALPMLREDT